MRFSTAFHSRSMHVLHMLLHCALVLSAQLPGDIYKYIVGLVANIGTEFKLCRALVARALTFGPSRKDGRGGKPEQNCFDGGKGCRLIDRWRCRRSGLQKHVRVCISHVIAVWSIGPQKQRRFRSRQSVGVITRPSEPPARRMPLIRVWTSGER